MPGDMPCRFGRPSVQPPAESQRRPRLYAIFPCRQPV